VTLDRWVAALVVGADHADGLADRSRFRSSVITMETAATVAFRSCCGPTTGYHGFEESIQKVGTHACCRLTVQETPSSGWAHSGLLMESLAQR